MVEQLQRKQGAEAIAVVIGDMAKERLSGSFELVYVVANSIMNLTTQEEQLGVLRTQRPISLRVAISWLN